VEYQLVGPVLMACLSQRHWFFYPVTIHLQQILQLINLIILCNSTVGHNYTIFE